MIVDAPAIGEELFSEACSLQCAGSAEHFPETFVAAEAVGHDGFSFECLKVLLCNAEAIQNMTNFVSRYWQQREVPADWHMAMVVAIQRRVDS